MHSYEDPAGIDRLFDQILNLQFRRGAMSGDVGGRLLLPALYWTFHLRRPIINVMFRGRRRMW